MGKFTFSKEERLDQEKWIKELFAKGSSFQFYPFRVISLAHPNPSYPTNQVLVTVSARNFPRAVDRNKIKRRIREAYRLNKNQLTSAEKKLIAYIYIAKEILPSEVIHEKLPLALERIQRKDHEAKR